MKNDNQILLDLTGIHTMLDAEANLSYAWEEYEETLAVFAEAVSNMKEAVDRLSSDLPLLLNASIIMTLLSPFEEDVERVISDERMEGLAHILSIIRK